MTKKQVEKLIDVYNKVIESPIEKKINYMGKDEELVRISKDDWEVFRALLTHRAHEEVAIGAICLTQERCGSIVHYHYENEDYVDWVYDIRSLHSIRVFLEILYNSLNLYERCEYEDLFKNWYEEELKRSDSE